MKPFEFHQATSVKEAAEVLVSNGTTMLLAGGQSLLLHLKAREIAPELVVGIGHLNELRGCADEGDRLVIGACTTYAALAGEVLPGPRQLIAEVAGNLADIAIRNVGTVGGAICEADPAFDFPVLALSLSASLEVTSAAGSREVALADFYAQPRSERLARGEIVTAVSFPAKAPSTGAAFEKFRYRHFEAAITSIGCVVDVSESGEVESAVVAVGGATSVPTRLHRAEAVLVGQRVTDDVAARVAEVAMDEADVTTQTPFAGRDYRRHLVGVLTRRAAVSAYGKSRG